MTIVVTGGGSGGHITPLLAVAHEIKKQSPKSRIIFIGQTGDKLGDIPAEDKNIDQVYSVRAGKFRRYHGEGLAQLLDLPTFFKNVRDFFFVLIGIWQSFRLLKQIKPEAIFIKGGFVGVPVGLAAAMLRIPYLTHDSDALPGLANRIIARWAKLHAVALPKEIYNYPSEKTITVGVPLQHYYVPISDTMMKEFRKQIGVPEQGRIVLVTGGGLGAQRLNLAVQASTPDLLLRYPDLTIILLAGRQHETEVRQYFKQHLPREQQERVIVKGFINNLYIYSGAADVVVTRAGATSMAEFAAQAKACVVVPNPVLTGGHQLKNAKVLADRKAVKMVREDVLRQDDHALMPPLVELLDDPKKREVLGARLASLAVPNASERLVKLLFEIAARL